MTDTRRVDSSELIPFPQSLWRRRQAPPPAPSLTDGASEFAVGYNCQTELELLHPRQALRVTEYLHHLAEERLAQHEAQSED